MKAGLFSIFIIVCFSINSYSFQPYISEIEVDTSLARTFFNRGNDFLKELKYDSSIVYLDKAKIIYEKHSLWENHFNCLNIIASVLRKKGEIDSSIVVLENVLAAAEEKLGEDNLTYAKMKNLLGLSYTIKGNFEKALDYANESLSVQLLSKNNEEAADTYFLLGLIYSKKGELDSSLKNLNIALNSSNPETQKELLASIYNQLGQVYADKKDHDKAIDYYKSALELQLKETGELHPEVSVLYNNIAVAYFYNEDNDSALEYYLKALSIDQQTREPDDFVIGLRYNNISMAYRVNENYDEALRYGGLAKEILIKKLGKDHPNVGTVINNIGRTYSDLGNYDKALELFQEGSEILYKKFGENHPLVAQSYANIGEVLGIKKDYSSAMQMLNKSLSIRLSVFGDNHPKVSESYERLGRVYQQMQNYDSALYSYQKSIISLTEGFDDTSVYANPEPEKILWNHDLLNSLTLKGEAFALRYSQSKDLNDLNSSYSCFELASKLVYNVRHSFKAEGSKLSFGAKAFSIYEKGIDISLKLFDLTKDDTYKKAAFKFSEESKAGLLFDAVSEVKARNFSGLPDTLLEKEKSLRVDLVYFETNILNEKQKKEPSSERIKEFEDKYFSLHQQYLSLLENLEKNYPAYYELKYKEKEISIENLQKMIGNKSVIVEYFLSDSVLYLFTLCNKELDIKKIKPDKPVLETVKQFRHSLHNLEFEEYTASALSLYKILIEPAEENISEAENLFIIPDGILYYLPFEALITEQVNVNNPDFSELPYLINSFEISYLSSTAFLDENKKLEMNYAFAGFAPVFADDDSKRDTKINKEMLVTQLKRAVEVNDKTYSELPESKYEVEGILDLFQKKNLAGKNFISENAKEEMVKSESMKDYQFLHIATHGFINENNPKLSGILFWIEDNTVGEDGILYSNEIYNLNLNADLVVLSACESGLGKIVKGEGIIGLTRGFTYSGAKNIIVSLWQVADKSTAELMIEFYKNVLDGKNYSSALREAKLKLIKDGTYSYPLEWSPFVFIGSLTQTLSKGEDF